MSDSDTELRRKLYRLILQWRKDEQSLRESARHALDILRTDGGQLVDKLVYVRNLDDQADMLAECGDRLDELLEGDDD